MRVGEAGVGLLLPAPSENPGATSSASAGRESAPDWDDEWGWLLPTIRDAGPTAARAAQGIGGGSSGHVGRKAGGGYSAAAQGGPPVQCESLVPVMVPSVGAQLPLASTMGRSGGASLPSNPRAGKAAYVGSRPGLFLPLQALRPGEAVLVLHCGRKRAQSIYAGGSGAGESKQGVEHQDDGDVDADADGVDVSDTALVVRVRVHPAENAPWMQSVLHECEGSTRAGGSDGTA